MRKCNFSPFFSAKGVVKFGVKFWWNFPCYVFQGLGARGKISATFSRVWVCEGKFHQNFTSKTVWKKKISRKFHSAGAWRWDLVTIWLTLGLRWGWVGLGSLLFGDVWGCVGDSHPTSLIISLTLSSPHSHLLCFSPRLDPLICSPLSFSICLWLSDPLSK